jgi:hypothetical protein
MVSFLKTISLSLSDEILIEVLSPFKMDAQEFNIRIVMNERLIFFIKN